MNSENNLNQQLFQQLLGWQLAGVDYLSKQPSSLTEEFKDFFIGNQALQDSAQNDNLTQNREVSRSLEMLESSITLFADKEPGAPKDILSVAQREKALKILREEVSKCTKCAELSSTRTQTVFGEGPLSPKLCFVGEAPGGDEDRLGLPFVGEAGKLLDKIILACGLNRKDVYVCNILRCRPPGNRQPKSSEASNCRMFLERQIELVSPEFICCLGAVASQNLLQTTRRIGELRGNFYDFRGIPVMCTFHPASLLPGRSPENKKIVWEDMKKLLTRMGLPIPKRESQKGG